MNTSVNSPNSQTVADQIIHIRTTAKEQIRGDLESLIAGHSFQVDADADAMSHIGAAGIGKQLTIEERIMLEDFGDGISAPFLIIDGLPEIDPLPDTPQQFLDDAVAQFVDCQLLGAIRLAGLQSIAFEYENFGRIMRNVAPVGRESDAVTSQGAKQPLKLHTDNGYEFEGSLCESSPAPHHLCFAGLRNKDSNGQPVATEILRVDDITNTAESGLLWTLQRKIFTIMPGQSNNRDPIGPVALLETSPASSQFWLRFNANDGQTLGQNQLADRAIAELKELLESLEDRVISINVQPGSILMFDNYRVLHRRSSFDPGDDLKLARWLRRCFSCQNRNNGRRVDRLHRPYVWK